MRRVLYIFGQLSDVDVDWLTTIGQRVEVPADGVLIQQGIHSDHLFFLVEGTLSVDVAGIGQVATLGRGEVVGEMSFVDNNPPGATVRAVERCLLLGIEKTEILAHMQTIPDFAGRFYKAIAIFLSARLRDTTIQLRGGKPVVDDGKIEGQLDDEVLKTVHLAAYRFNRLVEKVSS